MYSHLATTARVAEHPVDVRLATTEAKRRPNTHEAISRNFASGICPSFLKISINDKIWDVNRERTTVFYLL